jgi:hypothetical protein
MNVPSILDSCATAYTALRNILHISRKYVICNNCEIMLYTLGNQLPAHAYVWKNVLTGSCPFCSELGAASGTITIRNLLVM